MFLKSHLKKNNHILLVVQTKKLQMLNYTTYYSSWGEKGKVLNGVDMHQI